MVLSKEQEIIYLLSLVTAKVFIPSKCPFKTLFCFFSKKFHILIVLSKDPEIIYL